MNVRPFPIAALLATAIGLTTQTGVAATLYANNFDGNFVLDTGVVLNAATNGAFETAKPGFGNWSGNYFVNRRTGNPADPTTLTFTNLAPHSTISIAFLLGFLESWDSRDSGTSFGPDNLDLSIDGVQIISMTANNALGTIEDYAGGTELFDDVQLNDNMSFADALVDMSTAPLLTFAHSSTSLVVEVRASGAGWQGGADEAWGLDDVKITYDGRRVTPVPAPSALGLLVAAIGIGVSARRLRKTS